MAALPQILFMGTPDFAVPALQKIVAADFCTVSAVLTQPDKPAGRGRKLQAPAIKEEAARLGIPAFQPTSLKGLSSSEGALQYSGSDGECERLVASTTFLDAVIVVAYGKLVPPALLEFPRVGAVNIHPSLLPRWRGAAPIQHALFAGDSQTGVSIMKLDEGLDTGPVYGQKQIEISAEDNFGTLHNSLADISAQYLVELLPDILCGSLKAVPQAADGITYAEKWQKADCAIDWSEPAAVTLRRIRTCSPHLGARTRLLNQDVKLFGATLVPDQNFPDAPTGAIVDVSRAELIVHAGDAQYLSLLEMQFPGKQKLPIADILKGKSIAVGTQFEGVQ